MSSTRRLDTVGGHAVSIGIAFGVHVIIPTLLFWVVAQKIFLIRDIGWFIEHRGWGGAIFTSYRSRLTTADIIRYARLQKWPRKIEQHDKWKLRA